MLGVGQQTRLLRGGNPAHILRRAHIEAFQALDNRELNQWVLADNAQALGLSPSDLVPRQAIAIKLHNEFPTFTREAPYEDAISFKPRHDSEPQALRAYLDEFILDLSLRSFDASAERATFERLDRALADHAAAMRASNLQKALTSVRINVQWHDAVASVVAGGGALLHSLPLTTAAALSSLAGSVAASQAFGLKRANDRTPFQFLISVVVDNTAFFVIG